MILIDDDENDDDNYDKSGLMYVDMGATIMTNDNYDEQQL